MILEKEECFILHTAPHLDKTKLVSVFTVGQGWFRVIARMSTRLAGVPLEPFTPALLSCGGRGQLPALRLYEITAPARLHSVRTKMLGMYFNEIIMKLIKPYVPCSELFTAYRQSLEQLAFAPEDDKAEWILRRFEVAALDAAGHGLNLVNDTAEQPLDATAHYIYSPEDGAKRAQQGRRENTVSGLTLMCLNGTESAVKIDEDIRREAKQMMRYLIDYYLQGKTIRTRNLFKYMAARHAAI